MSAMSGKPTTGQPTLGQPALGQPTPGHEAVGQPAAAMLGRITPKTIFVSTGAAAGGGAPPASGRAAKAPPGKTGGGAKAAAVKNEDSPAQRLAARMSGPPTAPLFEDLAEGVTRRPPLVVVKPSSGLSNVRLLPVVIFVAGVMLSVRVNDIWKGYVALEAVSLTSQSEAQQPPPPGGRKRGQKTPATLAGANPADAGATPPAGPTAAASGGAATASAPAKLADAKPDASPPAVPGGNAGEGEPPTFTQNELDVLQKLSERRETLDARERELNLRENLIKAAEGRIDKKIAEMKSLQGNVESMLHQVDDQDDGKMKSLVKIYENMKPKDAAKIFEQLDMPILLGVMSHMKEQKVAPIMESMLPEKAKLVTDAMAQRRGAKSEGQGG